MGPVNWAGAQHAIGLPTSCVEPMSTQNMISKDTVYLWERRSAKSSSLIRLLDATCLNTSTNCHTILKAASTAPPNNKIKEQYNLKLTCTFTSFPQLFHDFSPNIPQIFLKYSSNIPQIFLKYSSNIPQIFLKYSSNIPQIFLKYSSNIPQIFLKYSSNT
ncbi:vacuolar sorting-associated 13C [Brachionus plicatilis]|uniref:Vacuolar sorting-associated 13C n=1 Tax=Brachionus plicatilis TaxID=10195 RepID=A0A3M7R536_BRAPC|nr:vacuolar sorting-associated 13C [Brachionus plicatilis]